MDFADKLIPGNIRHRRTSRWHKGLKPKLNSRGFRGPKGPLFHFPFWDFSSLFPRIFLAFHFSFLSN
jgi:hypothetical protein